MISRVIPTREVALVSKKEGISNIEVLERRKHWQDRRSNSDRRNLSRLHLSSYDCREETRRSSDLTGRLTEGEVWWNVNAAKYD